jgi:hypothetical protein
MSHITIIINRAAPPNADTAVETTGINYASVQYVPEDSMTDEQIAHKVKQLYKQVRELGS